MAQGGDDEAARQLSRLGYAQELLRAMGGFSSFALSFSIISILTGVTTTYGVALNGGGPAALGLGWPLVSVGTLVVGLAMAELASAFPTAGALYHWSALLGGTGWGWFTAMMNLVGQAAIVAAIDLGCAETLCATLRLSDAWHLPILLAILASHGLLNARSVRLVARLNDLSVTVHIVGVLGLVGLLLALGASHPVSFLAETGFTTRADGRYGLGFLNALLLGMWTFTGFDASAHVSEETHDPARRAPWGIVSAVLVSAAFGYAFVAALTLALPDVATTAADDNPPVYIVRHALGERAGNAAMGLAIVAMWFCGLSSVTSASRTLFAFARDGGVPFSERIRRVSAVHKTPEVAIATCVVMPLVLVLVSRLMRKEVFLAVASLATTGLYVSYATPIALGAVARRARRWTRPGPFTLGRLGVPLAWLAVLWAAFVLVVCVLPPNALAGVMLLGVAVALAALYFGVVRGNFTGPKISLAEIERQRANEAPVSSTSPLSS
jgi:amino acid transporter